MMETLEHRIRRYLLARLHRRAVLDLYEKAAVAGLLEGRFIAEDDISGTVWSVSAAASQFLAGARTRDREIVRRLIGFGESRREAESTFDWSDPAAAKPPTGRRTSTLTSGGTKSSSVDFSYVSVLLRESLPAPNPMHVAVALLVARAIGTSLSDLDVLMEVLRMTTPFVLLKAPVQRFEASLGMMLEDGLLTPFRAILEDVMRDGPLSGRYPDNRRPRPQRTIKTLAGSAVTKADDKAVRRQLRQTMLSGSTPIVVADETPLALTPVVTETVDLVVECGGLDRDLLADILHICAGTSPEQSLALMEAMDFDPHVLSLDDLVLAVRPRRSVEEVLTVLEMLANRFGDDDAAEKAAGGGTGGRRGSGGKRSVVTSSPKRDGKAGSTDVGIEIIEPVLAANRKLAKTSVPQTQTSVALVETLSGYGDAHNWALDLKADLALWRDAKLSWDEMSAKLLLSGPPGTGKTTYAKALCNTLQVPLLVTSVAHWLEPGYLGDVLKRMSGAFDLAASKAPAILFIDELDNIGSRQTGGGRPYDDYWTSLINRLLQLLDGATKTEGVVVVAATNLPEKIDPALLRSGRLETHVRIPLPDLGTLVGILSHHLGTDLADVVSSAPSASLQHRLKPRTPRDHVPGQLRRTSERRKSQKAKGAKP
ncbi:ATP-binding protein [Rhizobium pusense]|uniref:AAA family ATPase n=1 Tax=Agrobacterium pusense TaxID=648995 RepID=UPI000D1B13BB|nr:ATP-binding protein [Agrobacterium pusense]MDH0911161.1 ATP-binding protein [Agrobacterium pusense]MDH1097230.1 ATP-binding protein [Agrobacterium pusense]MDH1113686.1 ATP-binding protein [Agrobacterium pusense]MDH2193208.1 ATP-binding protein [Agrobacterium pusense]